MNVLTATDLIPVWDCHSTTPNKHGFDARSVPSAVSGPGNTARRKKSWDFQVTHRPQDDRQKSTGRCILPCPSELRGHWCLPGRWTWSLQLGAPHRFSSQSHLGSCSPWGVWSPLSSHGSKWVRTFVEMCRVFLSQWLRVSYWYLFGGSQECSTFCNVWDSPL